jgi:cytochrome c biogenesis protein CcmG/thiol:disulfide interchange protein DsbE
MGRRALLVGQGLAVGLVVLLFALLVWKLISDEGGDLARKADRGERPAAPDFTLEHLDGEGTLSLSSLEGKAVALNFWASWCIPCKEEAPILEQVWDERREQGLVVLGIDTKDFREDAQRFIRRYELSYPVVFDGPGKMLGRFGVTGFPETFVLDRQGRVVEAFIGSIAGEEEEARFRRAIEEALAS